MGFLLEPFVPFASKLDDGTCVASIVIPRTEEMVKKLNKETLRAETENAIGNII